MRLLILLSVYLCLASAQFRDPVRRDCERRRVHYEAHGKRYHFSWKALGTDFKMDWQSARNYCRRFCMDSISFNSRKEYEDIRDNVIKAEELDYIWTGGRKCNFKGCERPDLQPAIVNGWYWAPTGIRIRAKSECRICDWSHTGFFKQPQPDNREKRRDPRNGKDEACIAILNDFYNDGIKWHDVACHHTKPIICQEMPNLLEQVGLPVNP